MKIIGLVIIILGLGFTILTSISFFTREEIPKVQMVELTDNEPQYFSRSPFTGLGTIVFGVFLILQSRKKE